MKYVVSYEESYSKSYIVEADNIADARNIIEDAFASGAVALSVDDFDEWNIHSSRANGHDVKIYETYNPDEYGTYNPKTEYPTI